MGLISAPNEYPHHEVFFLFLFFFFFFFCFVVCFFLFLFFMTSRRKSSLNYHQILLLNKSKVICTDVKQDGYVTCRFVVSTGKRACC